MFQHVLNSRPPPTRLPMNGVRSSFERVKFRQPGTKHRPDRDIERNGSLREKCATTAQEKARHLSRLKFSLGSLARRAITVGQDERIVQHDPWQCHASEEREREREFSVTEGKRREATLNSPSSYLSSKFVVDFVEPEPDCISRARNCNPAVK